MLSRFVIAVLIIWLAILLVPERRIQAKPSAGIGGHEKRTTVYPGACDDQAGWYLVDSSPSTVTLGCWEEDSTDSDPNR
jgi:hypothetical protein